MTRRKIALWWSVLMIVAGTVGLATLPASAAPTGHIVRVVGHPDGTVTRTVDGKTVAPKAAGAAKSGLMQLTGDTFRSKYICLQNNIGSTWAIATASSYFESGANTVVLVNYGPTGARCGTYYDGRDIMAFGTINDPDPNACWSLNINTDVYGDYSATPIVGMNVSAASAACRNTLQHRNNSVSSAMGYVFGEDAFYSSTAYGAASIMNTYYSNSYNYAGADDRNTLYYVY